MRAAIDWSYDLLGSPEQRLFERLSVFAAGCTLAAATALYATEDVAEDDVLEVLSSLVDKSLVVVEFEEDEPRYRLLESFREYAREKLAARGEQTTMTHRHLAACLELAERLDRARTERYGVWRPLAPAEMDNWRVALQFALRDRCDALLGQRLVAVLPVGSMPIEVRQWVHLALELTDEQTPRSVVAKLRFVESMCAFGLREWTATVASCRRAMALYDELGDVRRVALAQDMAGHALTSLGRIDEAKTLIEAALMSARKLNDRRLLAWTLRCRGYVAAKSGDLVAARAYLAEALPVYREHFDASDLAYAINDLGMYEFCAGNVEAALGHATDMLVLTRERNDGARSVATALNAMSAYLVALNRYDEARQCAREALDLACEQHMDVFATYALQSVAVIAALRPQTSREASQHPHRCAARTLGWVDARLAAMGSSRLINQEQQYERALEALRAALGSDALAELMAAGAAMTQDQTIEEALET